MRQEINLLKIPLAPKVPKLSFTTAATTSSIFFVLLIAMLWVWDNELESINNDIVTIERNNSFKQKEAMQTGDITKHQTQLKSLEMQLMSKYQLWSNYKKITDAGKNGFSKHFFHIANLADDNLSLYEIDIYERGTSLALKGYARKAEYIPIYINELKNKPEFKGVFFGDLSIEKLHGHEVMRFSLDKKEEKGKEEKGINGEVNENIDISELLKMSLASASNQAAGTGKSIIRKGVQP
jgi:hypothetical protein